MRMRFANAGSYDIPCAYMKRPRDEFNVSDYVSRKRKIHRYHMIGYAVTAVVALVAMLVFWK